MAETRTLFDEDFLRRLEYLKILSTRLIPGQQKGEHRARKKGTGMEFADFRPYVAGDDIRDVDWRTYLRLDKLILRIFEEEADLPIYIFIDSSRSMGFGEPSKFDYARKVAAALCYIGLLNHDRVSLIAYSDGIADEISSRRGRNQVWRAFGFLDRMTVQGRTSLQKAFKSFFGAKRRRGLVVVISDFLDPGGVEDAYTLLRHFRHDLFSLQILSAEESKPGFADEVLLVDSEDGSSQRTQVTPRLLAAYETELGRHCLRIESYCGKYGWGYVRTLTDVPFEDLIMQVFRQDRFLS